MEPSGDEINDAVPIAESLAQPANTDSPHEHPADLQIPASAGSSPAEGEPGAGVDNETENDALPAVGKVFDAPSRSLSAIFAASRRGESAPARPAATPAVKGEFTPVMERLREALRPHGRGFDGLLAEGEIVALTDGRAIIRYRHEHEASAKMLERGGKRETVQQVLSEMLSRPLNLAIEVDAPPAQAAAPPAMPRPLKSSGETSRRIEPPAAPPPPAITAEQKQQLMENDPLVRAACEMFNGEIVKIESPTAE